LEFGQMSIRVHLILGSLVSKQYSIPETLSHQGSRRTILVSTKQELMNQK
jgi:hypothetical protein